MGNTHRRWSRNTLRFFFFFFFHFSRQRCSFYGQVNYVNSILRTLWSQVYQYTNIHMYTYICTLINNSSKASRLNVPPSFVASHNHTHSMEFSNLLQTHHSHQYFNDSAYASSLFPTFAAFELSTLLSNTSSHNSLVRFSFIFWSFSFGPFIVCEYHCSSCPFTYQIFIAILGLVSWGLIALPENPTHTHTHAATQPCPRKHISAITNMFVYVLFALVIAFTLAPALRHLRPFRRICLRLRLHLG